MVRLEDRGGVLIVVDLLDVWVNAIEVEESCIPCLNS